MRRSTSWKIALVSTVVLAGTPVGCSFNEVSDLRNQTEALRLDLEQRALHYEAVRDALPEDDPKRVEADLAAQHARAGEQAIASGIQRLDHMINEAANPTSELGQGVALLAPVLPAPLQVPVLLGGALVASMIRAAQLKRAAGSIARSLEKARALDPGLADAFGRQAQTLRSIQTRAARRIVDEATSDRFMVRLPL